MGLLTGSLLLRGLRGRCLRCFHHILVLDGHLHSLSIDNHISLHGGLHHILRMFFLVHVAIGHMLLIGPTTLTSQLLGWLGMGCQACGQFGIVGTARLYIFRYGLCEIRSPHTFLFVTCIVLRHESSCRHCTDWVGIVFSCVLWLRRTSTTG